MAKPAPLVITIYRNVLIFCTPASDSPLRFDFPPGAVTDLEITNRGQLTLAVKTFLDQNKVSPAPVVFVISESAYFDKDFPDSPSPADIQDFLDTVPFFTTSSKSFKTASGHKLVVINRDLYDAIRQVFEDSGFTVAAVVPGFILGQIGISDAIDAPACRLLLKRVDFLAANSFSTPTASDFHRTEQAFLNRYQIPLAIASLLAVVLAILVAYLTLGRRPVPPRSPAPPPLSASPSPASKLPGTLTARVIFGTSSASLAPAVTAQLNQLGLIQVQASASAAVIPSPVVIFSTAVSFGLRQQIVSALQSLFPNLRQQIASDVSADISVSLP